MLKLPAHKCGLYLEHNAHKDLYQSVAEYIKDDDLTNWPSEAEREKAIDTDELWEIRWYPETPISFCVATAATLEALLEFVNHDE
jgi:hypothetical protein